MPPRLLQKIKTFFLYLFACIGVLFVGVYIAMQFGLLNVKGSISSRNLYFSSSKKTAPAWADTEEWKLMKYVFTRDQNIIRKAARDAGVSPRVLLGGVIGEQFRFFGNRRELFKSYFEPLKILASLSNTSYGIAGLKPKTVKTIEENLKNVSSPFYLGKEMENIADYPNGSASDKLRLDRITDIKDPYYSYLYVGLYMKQIEAQWRAKGYPIDNRPDVLATLYNLGFYYSTPNADPQSGGSTVMISGSPYIFGDIAYEFYHSEELSDIFPLSVQ